MKSLKYYISLLAVAVLASCDDGTDDFLKSGKLFLDASYIGEVEVTEVNTRAGEDNDEPVYRYNEESLKNSTILWVSNEEGVVRKYKGLSTLPAKGLQLAGGVYLAEAWAGDSLSASWSARYYKAAEPFMINGDTQVGLQLKLANVFASVVIDKSIDQVLSDYQVTISHSRGSRTFIGKDTRVASFMMPTNHKAKEGEPRKEETLKWKMVGTEITGNRFEKEGAINYVAEGHQYILTFSHNGGVAANGGVLIGLDLKDLELIKNNNTVAQPPTIQGEKGKSLNDPVLISRGKCNNDIVVEIGAVGQFKVVELSGDWISSIIGPSGEKINLAEVPDKLEPNIKVTPFHEGQTDFYNPELNLSSMKISFPKSLISSLDNGTYEVEIYVEDNGGGDNSDDKSKHRKSRVTLTIVVSEEIISIRLPENFRNPELLNVTPSSLRIPAVLMDETAEFSNPALEYRVEGTESWSRVEPATVSRAASDYEFFIEGLTPNTSYECRTVWTKAGVESYSSIQKITTADNKAQNGDFEDWSMDGKIQLLAKDNTSLYWDSGNHGSAGNAFTSTNVTTSESNIKNSGKYSAKLQSQFVGVGGSLGKFAAGNAFVGKYLATDGTDGVLGWGRPFYFRPKALKGYVKYNSATITDVADGAPDIIKGQPDKGIIYVALLNEDKDVQGDKDYPDFPVVVRTKSAKLFDKTASNVIAYGELVLHNSTEGDGMIEFTIPLYYYESMKDQKVCYLLLVCSASKGGDYFAGGRGSTMYIDDFEFVY